MTANTIDSKVLQAVSRLSSDYDQRLALITKVR